jgi:predicted GIY-YIG superfamily endonuclease
MHYVYFLRSKSNPDATYTGMTKNPIRRLQEHNNGQNTHTKKNIPWEIEATFITEDEATALIVEAYFKNTSGKEKFTNFANTHPDHDNPKQGFFDTLEEGRGFGRGENRFIVRKQGGLTYFITATV